MTQESMSRQLSFSLLLPCWPPLILLDLPNLDQTPWGSADLEYSWKFLWVLCPDGNHPGVKKSFHGFNEFSCYKLSPCFLVYPKKVQTTAKVFMVSPKTEHTPPQDMGQPKGTSASLSDDSHPTLRAPTPMKPAGLLQPASSPCLPASVSTLALAEGWSSCRVAPQVPLTWALEWTLAREEEQVQTQPNQIWF